MKKLFSLLAVLLCVWMLAMPVFADLILPPPDKTEAAGEAVTEAAEAVVTTGAKTASSGSGAGQTILYLVIGAAVLAAAFVLFLRLRKPAK